MRGGFRSIAERLGGVVKEKATKAISKSSAVVSSAASTAYEKGKSSAVETARAASKDVSGRVERVYEQGKSATMDQVTSATKRASHVVRDTSSTIASSATSATKRASHVVRDTSSTIASSATEAAKEAKKEATKGIRWIWWWSLAAIGVYGIATTVPRELVRYALGGNSGKQLKDNEEGKNEEETPKSNNTILSWIASIGRSS
jgi:hypothetical protein